METTSRSGWFRRTVRAALLSWSAALALCGWSPESGSAQGRPVDVKRDSAERRSILAALRPEVEKELKQKVVFVVDSMKTQKGFAFTQVRAQRPNGRPIDYSKTRFAEDIKMGAFDEGIFALLRKDRKRWKLLQFSIGATDIPYVDWDTRFKAPRPLLGLPPRD